MIIYRKRVKTPLTSLLLEATDDALIAVRFAPAEPVQMPADDHPLLQLAERELGHYFATAEANFTVPLSFAGTSFQQRVWRALMAIPTGQTRSYQQLAQEINSPYAARAVGMANHHNPIAIIVPCHRVIGKDGSLTGYAGGIALKRWLLQHENPAAFKSP